MFPQFVQDAVQFAVIGVVVIMVSTVVYKVGMAVIHRIYADPEE